MNRTISDRRAWEGTCDFIATDFGVVVHDTETLLVLDREGCTYCVQKEGNQGLDQRLQCRVKQIGLLLKWFDLN